MQNEYNKCWHIRKNRRKKKRLPKTKQPLRTDSGYKNCSITRIKALSYPPQNAPKPKVWLNSLNFSRSSGCAQKLPPEIKRPSFQSQSRSPYPIILSAAKNPSKLWLTKPWPLPKGSMAQGSRDASGDLSMTIEDFVAPRLSPCLQNR